MGIAELYMSGTSTTAAQRQATSDRAGLIGAVACLTIAAVASIGMWFWGSMSATAWQAAEARIATAQASLEAVNARSAALVAARETAEREAAAPRLAMEELLGLIQTAYRSPTDDNIRAVRARFSDSAQAIFLPEATRLRDADLSLGGRSAFELTLLTTAREGADKAAISTREVWIYDERSADGSSVRCLREESLQTYVIQRVSGQWTIADMKLEDSSRASCQPASA
jgi:hypothetical protein